LIYRAGNDANIPRLPENLEVALNKMKESELAREIPGGTHLFQICGTKGKGGGGLQEGGRHRQHAGDGL